MWEHSPTTAADKKKEASLSYALEKVNQVFALGRFAQLHFSQELRRHIPEDKLCLAQESLVHCATNSSLALYGFFSH